MTSIYHFEKEKYGISQFIDWGLAEYFKDDEYISSTTTKHFFVLVCPCCGRKVGDSHDILDSTFHPRGILAESDVQTIDFTPVIRRIRCAEYQFRISGDLIGSPDKQGYEYVSTTSLLKMFLSTTDFGDQKILTHVSYGIGKYDWATFVYYVFYCPNEPDHIGVAWSEWDDEHFLMNIQRFCIPASQISQLPTFIAPQESPIRA